MASSELEKNIEKFINEIDSKDLVNAKQTLKSVVDAKLKERLDKIEKGEK
jgi:hypothetical protein